MLDDIEKALRIIFYIVSIAWILQQSSENYKKD